MRIAQVAPLFESVPPKLYGGTERVVSYLTEELVREGHDVTLFASGDSITAAKLISACDQALRLNEKCIDQLVYHIMMLDQVFDVADQFDIIHFHIDYLHYPFSSRQNVPHVTTLHGRLDMPDLLPLYRKFEKIPLVSISNSQREPLAFANWQTTVYHGLPEDLYTFHDSPGQYLAFLGRISPEKRVDRAIRIAKKLGMKIKIAAKVDATDEEYFKKEIEPMLNDPLVEFIQEIGEDQKSEFLGNATALVFPIDWPEPFGLVMIEAMACGTPTIAYRGGSVEEVIDDGVTGFVVESLDEAVDAAIEKLPSIDRREVRKVFEERFSVSRMAGDYVQVYERLIAKRGQSPRHLTDHVRIGTRH